MIIAGRMDVELNCESVRPAVIFVYPQGPWPAGSRPVDSPIWGIPGRQHHGMDRERLRKRAAGQFGLFTRAQAIACGYSAYQIRRRVADGEWQRVLGPTL